MKEIESLGKALGFDKWTVLGHSYGGIVAQQYALDYPNSDSKLILVSTFYSGEMWQENDNSSNIAGKDADFLISGAIGKLDFRDKLKDLRMPTLILQGRFDRISIPRFAVKYKSYAPQ